MLLHGKRCLDFANYTECENIIKEEETHAQTN
jgi:hypothetical protein